MYGQRSLSTAVPTWKATSDLFWATWMMQTSHKLKLAIIESHHESHHDAALEMRNIIGNETMCIFSVE